MSSRILVLLAALACFVAVARAYPAEDELAKSNQLPEIENEEPAEEGNAASEGEVDGAPEDEPEESEPGETLEKLSDIIKDGYEGLRGTINEVKELGAQLRSIWNSESD